MHILVSGSSGFIGSALVPFLASGGHHVTRLVRSSGASSDSTIQWNPEGGGLEAARLAGVDAVVHLAGENLASGRWTIERKRRIRNSRVQGTRLLCERLAGLSQPPRVVLCASAIGYYGSRGAEWLTEESRPGSGFLAELCQAWEAAADPAVRRGIRVVNLRMGVVLSLRGGALAKMLPPFRWGLGGPLGHGTQYLSWIALDDLLDIVQHVLVTDALRGPVNAVSPSPSTNREFTAALGRVLSRPTALPAPAFALRLVLGELADEALLSSARVSPARLLTTGYQFRYPGLDEALRHILGKAAVLQYVTEEAA